MDYIFLIEIFNNMIRVPGSAESSLKLGGWMFDEGGTV